ncbi:MAG TPA: hypothetical protein VIO94_11465 [Phenylobacterium sp.]
MIETPTSAVPDEGAADAKSLQARVQALQTQARELAALEVDALTATLHTALAQAREIIAGGEAFPVGVREQARRLTEELPAAAATLQGLMERAQADGGRSGPVGPVWRH